MNIKFTNDIEFKNSAICALKKVLVDIKNDDIKISDLSTSHIFKIEYIIKDFKIISVKQRLPERKFKHSIIYNNFQTPISEDVMVDLQKLIHGKDINILDYLKTRETQREIEKLDFIKNENEIIFDDTLNKLKTIINS